jgi:hypothetical protein
MVGGTERQQVGKTRLATVGPVLDMVGIEKAGVVTAGEGAAPVAGEQ